MTIDIDELIQQGVELQQAGDFAGSLAAFSKIVEADPTHAQAWYCKGIAHAEIQEFDQAIAAYRLSIEHAGERASMPLYNLGNLYQELHKPKEALLCFEEATQVDPEMADAWVNMGRIFDDLGSHQTAIECYDVALTLDDEDFVTWSNRGNSLRSLQQHEDATLSYRKALEFNADDFAAQVGLGVSLVEMGDVEPGLKLLTDAIETCGHPLAIFEKATALGKLDRNSEAIELFDRALEIGFHSREVLNNRAECLAKVDKTDEALKSFDRAIEVDKSFAPAYFGKARVLLNQDRLEGKQSRCQAIAISR